MTRHWGPSPKGGRRAMGRRWRPPTCSSGVGATVAGPSPVAAGAVAEVPSPVTAGAVGARAASTGTNLAAAISSRVSLRGFWRSKLSWWSVAYTRGPAAKVT